VRAYIEQCSAQYIGISLSLGQAASSGGLCSARVVTPVGCGII
jgi:hypothetical protein